MLGNGKEMGPFGASEPRIPFSTRLARNLPCIPFLEPGNASRLTMGHLTLQLHPFQNMEGPSRFSSRRFT